jgi:hypothetical protein
VLYVNEHRIGKPIIEVHPVCGRCIPEARDTIRPDGSIKKMRALTIMHGGGIHHCFYFPRLLTRRQYRILVCASEFTVALMIKVF